MTSEVPATPAALGVEWLRARLAGDPIFGSSRFRGLSAEIIGVGYGLDGTIARLAWDDSGDGVPTSLVAKLASAELGRNEAAFYERIGPRLPLRLARFHGAQIDDEADRSVLLLEDWTHAAQGDAVRGATPEQAEALIHAMARFHATFAGASSEALAPLDDWAGNVSSRLVRIEQRRARFLERYGDGLGGPERALLDALPGRLPAALAALEADAPTLIHTDLHLDNVLFGSSGEAVVIDWPHARRGPAALDVARLFVEGLTVPARRRDEKALLAMYGSSRAQAGAPWEPVGGEASAIEAAVLSYVAYALSWGGAEDPGFDTPRVRDIVDSLVRNTLAAALDYMG